jgi:porphobilinogen synthase
VIDGRVGAIRAGLDAENPRRCRFYVTLPNMPRPSNGPFRDAIGTNATLTGDKRTYQSTFHKILHERKTHGKPSATKRTSP